MRPIKSASDYPRTRPQHESRQFTLETYVKDGQQDLPVRRIKLFQYKQKGPNSWNSDQIRLSQK